MKALLGFAADFGRVATVYHPAGCLARDFPQLRRPCPGNLPGAFQTRRRPLVCSPDNPMRSRGFPEFSMRRFPLPVLIVTAALLSQAGAAVAGPFKDANLEAAVRAVLQVQDAKAELTDAQLMNVSVLEASGKKIKDLTGLDKCKNLLGLTLTNNEIADVTPLKGLTNLQTLDLAGNQIADITPLAGLTKLQRLELSGNQVAKLDALSGLPALMSLYLTGNKVSDISPLAGLTKLAMLNLGKNQIKDISALEKVNRIETLELTENEVENLAPLGKQTQLRLLMLEKNKIKDLTPLVEACKADAEGQKRWAPYLELYLKDNPLSDESKKQLETLKGFGVRIKS